MKLLVIGGESYLDGKRVFEILDSLHGNKPISLLIHVDTVGAPMLADQWANVRGIDCLRCNGRAGVFTEWSMESLKFSEELKRQIAAFNYSPEVVLAFPGKRLVACLVDHATRLQIPVVPVDTRGTTQLCLW